MNVNQDRRPMTGPDAAAEQDEVLAQLVNAVEALSAQQEQLDASQSEMGATIVKIMEELQDDVDDSPLSPWTRSERTSQDWADLVDWLDLMTSAHSVHELPPCWVAHEELVLEVEAARSAWIGAARRHARRRGSDLSSWYAYVWHPLRRRFGEWQQCRNGHVADRLAPSTDRTLVPAAPSQSAAQQAAPEMHEMGGDPSWHDEPEDITL